VSKIGRSFTIDTQVWVWLEEGGIKTLTSAFKNNKDQMVRIGAGALAAKLVVGSLGGSKILGAVGPLKLRA
jgi:uncharacterized membrane protein YebE (DUF533 family)